MPRLTRAALRKLGKLGPSGWRDLLEAQLALLRAQLIVATRPTGQLLASATTVSSPGFAEPTFDARAERFALAVSRAADYGVFRPLCLVRAVALQQVLERHGIRGSRIRIGVRMRKEKFAAHAWVEYLGLTLGDAEEHVSSFAELADVRLADGR